MKKLFRSIRPVGRKRRRLVVGAALRLLRLVREVEETETRRCSDERSCCEQALGFLNRAIGDLESAYEERF